ncbi:MAG: sigma-70 family RNA polymerase sigma factor [Deltaproteobacteria bacterium]|nr:MAG: sigma-70 family RNA polymerase sigma factor [Deltaproteobacteria bacterium]
MSEELYQSWVEQHTEDVYHYFRCHLKLSVEQSEELTHQTFIAAWKSMDKYSGLSGVKAWLLGIARNMGRKLFHAQKRLAISGDMERELREETSSWGATSDTPEQLLQRKQDVEMLYHVVSELPEKKREVFSLRYLHNLSVDEVAAFLDEPKETIRSRLRFAREEVKKKWERRIRQNHS